MDVAAPGQPPAVAAVQAPAAVAPNATLTQRAIAALAAALPSPGEASNPRNDERSVYRPDSWLIQRCWETLAAHGAAAPALQVAQLAADRHLLAPLQCLHRLAEGIDRHFGLAQFVGQELNRRLGALLANALVVDVTQQRDVLLYAGAVAARVGDRYTAFACLERLDQLPQPWERCLVQPEQRARLAAIVRQVGLQPLTAALLSQALRRFGDTGAQFLVEVIGAESGRQRLPPGGPRAARLLGAVTDAFRNATLTSLHSRRLATIAFGQSGDVAAVIDQLDTIANIQIARRESGLSTRSHDPALLRQVKRPSANPDVDFQIYTLRGAVRTMPVRRVSREARIELADRLALLGAQSDGWTAASAAATLVELGAVQYAVEVVSQIPPRDPTRAEGIIELVRNLLAADESQLADEQVQKGFAWASSYPGRNPERALVSGLVDVYLAHGQPAKALSLLNGRQEGGGTWRRLLGRPLDDDQLRNAGLRLRAQLLLDQLQPRAVETTVNELRTAALRLLEGEALVNFLVDTLLKPLLASGRTRLALTLLPTLLAALRTGAGEKHAARVGAVANALVAELLPLPGRDDAAGPQEAASAIDPGARDALEQFAAELWRQDGERGLWQTVHGIDGSLPLLLGLEGPAAVLAVALAAAEIGRQWTT